MIIRVILPVYAFGDGVLEMRAQAPARDVLNGGGHVLASGGIAPTQPGLGDVGPAAASPVEIPERSIAVTTRSPRVPAGLGARWCRISRLMNAPDNRAR